MLWLTFPLTYVLSVERQNFTRIAMGTSMIISDSQEEILVYFREQHS